MFYYSINLNKFPINSSHCLLNKIKKEFHISKEAREQYEINKELFSITGNIIFKDTYAIREFCESINLKRKSKNQPTFTTNEINGVALLDEIKHYIISVYKQEQDNEIIEKLINYINKKVGNEKLQKTLEKFVEKFPPSSFYKSEKSTKDFLKENSNFETEFEEMIILFINNENPAFNKFKEFFDDSQLSNTSYFQIIKEIKNYFKRNENLETKENLLEMLYLPQIESPLDIEGQLSFVKEKWGLKLNYLFGKLLKCLDLSKEENRFASPGPGPSKIYSFTNDKNIEEIEQFSEDHSWMPEVVMIAKSTYVWLYQLSKQYNVEIKTLDQIPIEELKLLKSKGFNTLWLIGIWERSKASKKIKELCGNPEALSSAYSIYDYEIANELGGEHGYSILKEKCNSIGIRLAADMVPNHFGIDSKWVHQFPNRFLSVDKPPYPAYNYSGENLSTDNNLVIQIEDKYYSKEDAAVVFKRFDKRNNETKYIYHGNDGTTMPWNDTAQLDYTKIEVREEIIKTIIKVAKKFPVIRFDAAMTLAKKHYKRLWFPNPGEGGDIPSRSEFYKTEEEFNKLMPKEFFREVVDRIAVESPGTLLLAEAFWLMEGYFVRTLGMHRVYNSAFMNMIKNEENEKYKLSLKNILLFDKEILKRFVNFLSNPDEETAIEQFGKDDKYFGACMMLSTLPGLPMFAHGQIEGFKEKYGMEYKKSYINEFPDNDFINRHYREIFPLLSLRKYFAESENFNLFDFFTLDNKVNHNVFAYSNSFENKVFLCFFNNKYEETKGFVNISAPFVEKNNNKKLEKTNKLSDILKIPNSDKHYLIFNDFISKQLYLRNCKEIYETGLSFNLNAFKYFVFNNFKIIEDNFGYYKKAYEKIKLEGTHSIDNLISKIKYEKIYYYFESLKKSENKNQFEKNINLILEELVNNFITLDKEFKNHIFNLIDIFFQKINKQKNKNILIISFSLFILNIVLEKINLKNEINLSETLDFNFETKELIKVVETIFNYLQKPTASFSKLFNLLVKEKKIRSYLKINSYNSIEYFNKEMFEELIDYILTITLPIKFKNTKNFKKHILNTAKYSNYNLEKFILLV